MRRETEVANLKEIYSKDYLLRTGLVTSEEYDRIPASTSRRDALRKAQDIAEIWHKTL